MNAYHRELSDCAAKDSAANIINGFLNRFEAPTCVEQALVVSSANAWLKAYEADDFRSLATSTAKNSYLPFAGKAISQQNQNDNNHTD